MQISVHEGEKNGFRQILLWTSLSMHKQHVNLLLSHHPPRTLSLTLYLDMKRPTYNDYYYIQQNLNAHYWHIALVEFKQTKCTHIEAKRIRRLMMCSEIVLTEIYEWLKIYQFLSLKFKVIFKDTFFEDIIRIVHTYTHTRIYFWLIM